MRGRPDLRCRPTGWRSISIICLAIVGLIGGLSYAKPQRIPADFFPAGMPLYPDVSYVPAGPQMHFGGSRSKMAMFDTADDVDRVARFFEQFWRARGYWLREDVTHLGGVVSAVDGRHSRVHQVLIIRQGKRTLVFPSVTEQPWRALQGSAPPPIDLFPKSKLLMAGGAVDVTARSQSWFSVNGGSIKANLQHYRRALRAAGYRVEPHGDGRKPTRKLLASLGKRGRAIGDALSRVSDQRVLVYRHASGRELSVSLAPTKGDRVRVHIMMVQP